MNSTTQEYSFVEAKACILSLTKKLMLKGKIVTIGITGSIAAFKVPNLIRILQKKGAIVRCIATKDALKFVSITTLECLTNQPVYRDEIKLNPLEHIDLANTTDLFILAPLTANTLNKISGGIADNVLTSVVLTTRKPILLCPAMNAGMWENQILKRNLEKLLKINNFKLVHPGTGELACCEIGVGRLANLEEIELEAEKIFTPQILENKKILISLGSTREPLDPVRFISNHSSGKMGYALAETAYLMGAEVKIIAGHTETASNFPLENIKVKTTQEMLAKALEYFPECDIFVSVAAVSDFQTDISKAKIPSGSTLKLKLKPTEDILKTLAKKKKEKQIIVGFALESEDLESNAKAKLKAKKLDFIVANSLETLGADESNCLLIGKTKTENFAKQPKMDLATKLWRAIV